MLTRIAQSHTNNLKMPENAREIMLSLSTIKDIKKLLPDIFQIW